MPVRILHLADIHLGSIQKFLSPEKQQLRSQEILQTFTLLIRESINDASPVDAILICGDLFDRPIPDVRILEKVKSTFEEASQKEIPIILIPGNHDNIITPNSVYRKENFPGVFPLLSANIKEPLQLTFQGKLFNFYGMAYSFLSEPPFDEFRPLNKDAVNVALIHGSLQGDPNWRLHSQEIPLDKEKLFKSGFDYIALGHYHEFRHLEQAGRHIVYPGSLEPLGWSEEKPRQVVLAEFDNGGISLKNQDLQFQQKFYKTVELDCSNYNFASSEDLTNFIVKKYANGHYFLRVVLKGRINFLADVSRVKAQCEGQFFFFDIIDQTSVVNFEKLAIFQDENTIRGVAIRKLLAKAEKKKDETDATTKEALKILLGYFSRD